MSTDERTDLTPVLSALAGSGVRLSAPAEPVWLPAAVAGEIRAAVRAALDNVTRHAGPGAEVFMLVDNEADEVVVSVRDTGRGIAAGRLLEAERAGRMGLAQSIRARIEGVGGTVTLTSGEGEGTEVELHVPRRSS